MAVTTAVSLCYKITYGYAARISAESQIKELLFLSSTDCHHCTKLKRTHNSLPDNHKDIEDQVEGAVALSSPRKSRPCSRSCVHYSFHKRKAFDFGFVWNCNMGIHAFHSPFCVGTQRTYTGS